MQRFKRFDDDGMPLPGHAKSAAPHRECSSATSRHQCIPVRHGFPAGEHVPISPWGVSPRGGLGPARVFFHELIIIGFLFFVFLFFVFLWFLFAVFIDFLCWSWLIRFPDSCPGFPIMANRRA